MTWKIPKHAPTWNWIFGHHIKTAWANFTETPSYKGWLPQDFIETSVAYTALDIMGSSLKIFKHAKMSKKVVTTLS